MATVLRATDHEEVLLKLTKIRDAEALPVDLQQPLRAMATLTKRPLSVLLEMHLTDEEVAKRTIEEDSKVNPSWPDPLPIVWSE